MATKGRGGEGFTDRPAIFEAFTQGAMGEAEGFRPSVEGTGGAVVGQARFERLIPVVWRGSQSFFYRPATLEAAFDDGRAESKRIGPAGAWEGDAVEGDEVSCRFIAGLLRYGFPPNIAGLIITIVIDATEGIGRSRAGAEVVVEGIKGADPFLANHNSTTAVAGVVAGARVKTSSFHADPGHILCRAATFPRVLPHAPKVPAGMACLQDISCRRELGVTIAA